LFDRILVSTDDEEIASIAVRMGLDVPFLRNKCYDDYSTVSSATIAALEQVETELNETYRVVVQLMPNCPLRDHLNIVDAFEAFQRVNSSFQISCFKFGWMNPWWAVRLDENNHPSPLFPEIWGKRSQDLSDLFCPTGAIWIANVADLKRDGTFYGPSYVFYPLDWKAAIDIDDTSDLEMALAVSNTMKRPR